MHSFLKSVFVSDLFEKNNNYFIEFHNGANCLFGDNGTGKTTLIDLIVASLNCNLPTLMKINFSHITLIIEGSNGDEKEVTVYKAEHSESKLDPLLKSLRFKETNNKNNIRYTRDLQEDFFEDLFDEHIDSQYPTKIIYDFGDEDFTFDIPEDEVKIFYLKKILRSRKHIAVISKLRSIASLTHVPLIRLHNEDDLFEDEINYRRRNIELGALIEKNKSLDPSYIVLRNIEASFKSIAKEHHSSDTKKLEEFKSKIIQKFLVQKSDLAALPKLSRALDEEEVYNISELMAQLSSAGLEVPEDKLIENFDLINQLTHRVSLAIDASEKAKASKSSNEKKIKTEKDVSEAFVRLLVARTLFERLESVLEDVEKLQSERNEIRAPFRKYENTVNKFLNKNKSFRITKDGEFEIKAGERIINLENLSSGEKHIIAILGRAALTRDNGSIFIADEPELSLHLTWQRMMLPSILALSPKSQIIVATHSPAIIPKEANKIDLGACL